VTGKTIEELLRDLGAHDISFGFDEGLDDETAGARNEAIVLASRVTLAVFGPNEVPRNWPPRFRAARRSTSKLRMGIDECAVSEYP